MRGFCTILISIVALFATQVLPDFECCNADSVTLYGDVIEEVDQIDYSDFPDPICLQSNLCQRGGASRRVVSYGKSNKISSATISFNLDCTATTFCIKECGVVVARGLSAVIKWHRIRI